MLRTYTPAHWNRAVALRAAFLRALAIIAFAAIAGCTENQPSAPARPLVTVEQGLIIKPVPVTPAPNIIPVVQTVELYDPVRRRFVIGAAMPDGRAFHTATLLSEGASAGRVLIIGGISGSGATSQTFEFYDASGDTFSVADGIPAFDREDHVAAELRNGQILVAGGMQIALRRSDTYKRATGEFAARYSRAETRPPPATPLAFLPRGVGAWGEARGVAYLYDPARESAERTSTPDQARVLATSTTLRDGRILIAGGLSANGESLATAEIFDPSIEEFTSTGRMSEPRACAVAMLLRDGTVLIAGGMDRGRVLSSAEIYHPVSGKFSRARGMTAARACATATMLTSGTRAGRILIAGGWEKAGGVALSSAEVYNPRTHRFVHVGEMSSPRAEHTATAIVGDGNVLIAGGMDAPGRVLSTAELYDSSTGRFAAIDGMAAPRVGHTATVLPDGRVLIAGGVSGAATVITP